MFGCLFVSAVGCNEPPKSDNQMFVETLDSITTERSTFIHANDASIRKLADSSK